MTARNIIQYWYSEIVRDTKIEVLHELPLLDSGSQSDVLYGSASVLWSHTTTVGCSLSALLESRAQLCQTKLKPHVSCLGLISVYVF